ncbi:MAG TPA: beta-galactosidase [Acidimicrobiales bacterium]|nr:beta-galactosidase [Acidimicrobiales bacterium]
MSERVHYGGDYNPEQWPREVWDEDVKLMREAGVDLVTVGVFSWAQLEPREGAYTFGWLEELLDLLGSEGIGVDLATPTASPPPWLSTKYPDLLPVDSKGARYSHGSRQAICILNPTYREKARDIVSRLAAAVGGHRALRMWHVHNEYACHVPYCYCARHAGAFREWLKRRYASLEELNQAWGTTFWSQTYTDWDEVVAPRMTATFVNPGLDLDYKRFSSDAFLEEFREEREILKRARPDLPVTTNFMGFFKPLDYFRWAAELDVVSTDNYSDPANPDWAMESAMHYDLVRGLNKRVPWMVMEQASSRVNWRPHNSAKRPGEMRAMSYQAVARGASSVLFFQWRASRAGAEKFHSAMLPHAGTSSPVWADVAALGKELEDLDGLQGLAVQAKVAMLFSWPNWWAVEAPAQPANDLRLADQLRWLYQPLYQSGVTVDFCSPDEPLDNYEVVLVPSLYLLSEEQGVRLASYVERGGTVVTSFWSGIVDEHDAVRLGPYGGPLRVIMGCDVLEICPLPPSEPVQLQWEDGHVSAASYWADIATESGGRVLAYVADGPWSGRPLVFETTYGKGRSYYLGTKLDASGLSWIYEQVPALRAWHGFGTTGQGVERVVRASSSRTYEFLINYAPQRRTVQVAPGGFDILGQAEVGERVTLPPAGVAIIRRPGARQFA